MEDATLNVTLELRIDGDSLSGRATGDEGEIVEFDGWLGLLAALDTLVSATSVSTTPVSTTSDVSSGRES